MAKAKTIMDSDVSVNNDDFKVVLTYIGEGCCGDYDESDPEDYPCIRADVYALEDEDDEVLASTCTGMNADISVKEAKKYAMSILRKFTSKRGDPYNVLADCV